MSDKQTSTVVSHERALIGAIIQSPNLFPYASDLTHIDFVGAGHSLAWQVLNEWHNDLPKGQTLPSGELGMAAFHTRIQKESDTEAFTKKAIVGYCKLGEAVKTRQDIEYQVKQIQDAVSRRLMQAAADELKQNADKPGGKTTAELAEHFGGKVMGISTDHIDKSRKPTTFNDESKERKERIRLLREGKIKPGKKNAVVKTGWTTFDKWRCLEKRKFCVFAGKFGSGKTTFLLNILLRIAKQKKGVIFFTLEVEKEKIFDSIYSILSGVPMEKIEDEDMTQDEWERYSNAVQEWEGLEFIVEDINDLTCEQIIQKAEGHRASWRERGIEDGAVGVDYLQDITKSGVTARFGGNMFMPDEYRHIVRQFHLYTLRRLDCPFILTAQVNRDAKGKGGTLPTLINIESTSQPEKKCQLGVVIHREIVAKGESQQRDVFKTQIVVEKNRDRQTGKITFDTVANCKQFEEADGLAGDAIFLEGDDSPAPVKKQDSGLNYREHTNPERQKQVGVIYFLLKNNNKNWDFADAICKSDYNGTSITELEKGELSSLIDKIKTALGIPVDDWEYKKEKQETEKQHENPFADPPPTEAGEDF